MGIYAYYLITLHDADGFQDISETEFYSELGIGTGFLKKTEMLV
jgi:hypothetical protein